MRWVPVLFFSVTAFGQLFHQTWKGVPRTLPQCDEVARELAQKLHGVSGAEIYWAESLRQTPDSCDVRISYLSGVRLSFVNTLDSDGVSIAVSQAAYLSVEECNRALGVETRWLERATGRRAWLSYCFEWERKVTAYRFGVFAEVIGESPVRLYASSRSLLGKPLRGTAKTLEALSETENGGTFVATVRVGKIDLFTDHEVSVRLYSRERRWLDVSGYAESLSAETCESQLDYAREFLRAAAVPPLWAVCVEGAGKVYRMVVVSLTRKVGESQSVRSLTDPKTVGTFEGCLESVSATEEFHRKTLNRPILGGVCAGSIGRWQVVLFESAF